MKQSIVSLCILVSLFNDTLRFTMLYLVSISNWTFTYQVENSPVLSAFLFCNFLFFLILEILTIRFETDNFIHLIIWSLLASPTALHVPSLSKTNQKSQLIIIEITLIKNQNFPLHSVMIQHLLSHSKYVVSPF